MTPEQIVELLRLIRKHRVWDEQGECWLIDADQLETAILGVDPEPAAADDHDCPGAECPGLRYTGQPERGHYPRGRYGWLADS